MLGKPLHSICDYLTQVRTALESRDFDVLEKLTNDLDHSPLTLRSAIQNESTDIPDLASLRDEVADLIHLAQLQKQELAENICLINERKKSIAAYVRNK